MYKVFLVDDEEITLNQTAETVPWLDNGYQVIGTETDPARAVERIREEEPEVVFCDLKMPKMDGHELMRRVHEAGLHPEFVMLSAYDNFNDARTFFRQEGFDYLLKPMQMQEVAIILEKLTRKLADKYPADPAFEGEEAEQSTLESFQALVNYIQANFKNNYTLEQLSKQYGISSSYICALFTRYFNTSFTCYMTKLRMEEAARLILEGKLTFKSIALECGYKDYYYFSKVFKGYYGISPAQYKETGKGLDHNAEET